MTARSSNARAPWPSAALLAPGLLLVLRSTSTTRTKRLLSELYDTLDPFAANRNTRPVVLVFLQASRTSTAGEDKALLEAPKKIIRDEDKLKIIATLRKTVHERTRHPYEPVPPADAMAMLGELDKEQKKRSRKASRPLPSSTSASAPSTGFRHIRIRTTTSPALQRLGCRAARHPERRLR